MERESFEDQEVADVLNKKFICIKVDREERPDIDNIYMKACQVMTGRGGWPLSVFMTPDQKPFYTATYIPKKSRYGMPGIIDLSQKLHELWMKNSTDVLNYADDFTKSLTQLSETDKIRIPEKKTIENCFLRLEHTFDNEYGGFGNTPKFPVPQNLLFLLRYYHSQNNNKALQIVEKTLDSMAKGGIYDHIGGGFARYSTDKIWLVPHFEKMLYDNALLIMCYAEAYQNTDKEIYKTIVKDTLTYVKREMTSPEGAFYSAEDADSEGEEGKYYVWTQEEIIDVLGEKEGIEFCKSYDISSRGNFEGKNIPNLIHNPNWENDYIQYAQTKEKLIFSRNSRIHPHKDDKILTSWNGLMIAACAIAGRVMGEKDYIGMGATAFQFIENKLVDKNQRLYARYRDGEKRYLAYVDDYAYMIWAALELLESTGNTSYLDKAQWYSSQMIHLFWDKKNGGLFFNGTDSEKLLTNPKEAYDNALPSGNSTAAYNLIRLGRLIEDEISGKYGEKIIDAFSKGLMEFPEAYAFMVSALLFQLSEHDKVILCGEKSDRVFKKARETILRSYLPFTSKVVVDEVNNQGRYKGFYIDNESALYVCKGFSCNKPVKGEDILKELVH